VVGAAAVDRHHAPQAVDRARELLVVHEVLVEEVAQEPQLVQDQLEPQLEDLVHGDEQHLVVRELGFVGRQARLQREQLLDAHVVPVVRRGGDRHLRRSLGHESASVWTSGFSRVPRPFGALSGGGLERGAPGRP
jgi:hypothetical protein